MIKKIAQGYVKTENVITNLLMIGVVLFVFVAAVMRWAGYPIVWSVEFAQLLFVWVIFLGANRALRENKHIGVDFFTRKLPGKLSAFVEIIMDLLVLGFLGFIFYFGILLSIENSLRLINNLTISYSIVTLSVPVGSALMIITILIKIKEKILKIAGSGE
ncbi:TRAP transporter small permease [Oceanobacillus sojae]|uniref:TRAP transporter small permease n=1 Tax=Oceanobacillus sojae TaxID=582851 RepID=UPI00098840D8|nr:TRAP transporter small permease [Oceanobacillus sojae]MCT1901681.1 TRAP transporter small permease [Oceanobacillus sojae]